MIKRILTVTLLLIVYSTGYSQTSRYIIDKHLITIDSLKNFFYSVLEKRFSVNELDSVWNDSIDQLEKTDFYSIVYMSDGLKVKGFMAEPKEEGRYPCIIANRGGNREFGKLTILRFAFMAGKPAAEGYVVIASNYRGVDGGEGAEEFGGKDIDDVLNLIPVLAECSKADTSRIGMQGWSRGGMMTFLALKKTDKIKAVVVGGALTELNSTITERPAMETNVFAELIPDYEQNKKEELEKRSAIQWVNQLPKNVPILMMHGTSDWRVSPDQSLNMALQFQKYRIPYRLIMFEGADHGVNEFYEESEEQTIDWFDKYVKNLNPLPDMEFHGN